MKIIEGHENMVPNKYLKVVLH